MHFMEGLSNSLSRLLPFGEYFPEKFLAGCPEYIEAERYFLYSSCQILSVLYSFVACVTMLKILRLFDIRGKGAMLISAFVTLYPRNIQFSGMLNNDGVSYMFAILALYFALKWWKRDKGFGNILACGLCVGLGMMSKLGLSSHRGNFCLGICRLSKEERRSAVPSKAVCGIRGISSRMCAARTLVSGVCETSV